MSRKSMVNFFYALAAGLAFFPAAVTGLFATQRIQEDRFPIIVDFTVNHADWRRDGSLILKGSLTKRFDWCTYDQAQWFAVGGDGMQHRIGWDSIEQPNLPNTGSNRPAGKQTFGPWAIYTQGAPDANELWLVVDHHCLGWWPTRTRIGPLRIPRKN